MSTNKFIIQISVRNKVSLEIFTFSEDITQTCIQQIPLNFIDSHSVIFF